MKKIGMILIVDTWVWLKLLEDTTDIHYETCMNYLRNNQLYTTILNIYEIFYLAMDRLNQEQALEFIQTIQSHATVVTIDESLALGAAKIHRSESLPAIDAFVYATALKYNANVLTGDPHFKGKKRTVFIE